MYHGVAQKVPEPGLEGGVVAALVPSPSLIHRSTAYCSSQIRPPDSILISSHQPHANFSNAGQAGVRAAPGKCRREMQLRSSD